MDTLADKTFIFLQSTGVCKRQEPMRLPQSVLLPAILYYIGLRKILQNIFQKMVFYSSQKSIIALEKAYLQLSAKSNV